MFSGRGSASNRLSQCSASLYPSTNNWNDPTCHVDREGQKETERQRERERPRQGQRETEREGKRDRYRERETHTHIRYTKSREIHLQKDGE